MSLIKIGKKLLGIVCLLVVAVTLFSCDTISESAIIAAKRQAKEDAKTVLGKLVWDVQDSTAITADIELATGNKNFPNVTISWTSSEPDVISETGKVTRTAYDDPRAVVADGSESESYETEEDGQVVVKYRDKVVPVEITAHVVGTYSYDVETTDVDGYTKFETVTIELPEVTKTFNFTVLTVPHGVGAGTIAQVKADAWNYVYEVSGVSKTLVSASSTTYAAMTTGVVTAKLQGDTRGFMIHDTTEGIYVYADNSKINVGDYVQVLGNIYTYYGSLQFGSDITVTKLDVEPSFALTDADYRLVTPSQLEAEHADYSKAIGYFGGKLLTIAGIVTARTAPAGSGKYCILDAEDGTEVTWLYYKGYNAEMEETIKALDGKYVEAKVVSYDRDSRLTKNEVLWTGVYEEKAAPEMNDTTKLNLALGEVKLNEEYTEDFDLPALSVGSVVWSVKSGTGVTVNGNKATVTRTEADQTVVLLATATLNTTVVTKEFTIKVPKIVNIKYFMSTAPVAGVEYYFGFKQESLSKDLFFTGVMDSYYGATGDVSEAVKVVLEETDGGFHLSFKVENAKKYFNLVQSGKYINVSLDDEASTVWVFNTEYNTLTTTFGEDVYYMGSYGSNTNFRASKISYAATSYVAHLFAEDEFAMDTNPTVGKEYVISLYQKNLDKTLFLNGTVSGNFLGSTENAAEAVKVGLEAVDGGFNIFLNTAEGKKYLNAEIISETKPTVYARIGDTASTVWVYDSENNTFTMTCGEFTMYMGTYNSFNTFSMSKISYAATSFVSHFYVATGASVVQSDESKVEEALGKITLNESYAADFDLPTVEGFTVAWAVKSGNGIVIQDGKAIVSQGDEELTVVLTVTVSLNEASASKELTVKIPAKQQEEQPELTLVTAPEVGKEYVISLTQGTLENKVLFLTGVASGNFLESSEKLDEAAKVMLEATEGGYHVALTVGEAKKYLNAEIISETKPTVYARIGDEASTVWAFNTDHNTLTMVCGEFTMYMGTYSTFNTFSMSKISYAATSFVSHLFTVESGETPVETGVVATFTFGENGEAKHVDGTALSDDYVETSGNYTLTITNASKVYSGAKDAMGNSCLKLGTSSATASFSFTVPENVKSVVIYFAAYKTAANGCQLSINGGEAVEATTASNDGQYTAVEIDTTTVKTIVVTTLTAAKRGMINTIEFKA